MTKVATNQPSRVTSVVTSSYFFRSVNGMGFESWMNCPAISVPSLFIVPSKEAWAILIPNSTF